MKTLSSHRADVLASPGDLKNLLARYLTGTGGAVEAITNEFCAALANAMHASTAENVLDLLDAFNQLVEDDFIHDSGKHPRRD